MVARRRSKPALVVRVSRSLSARSISEWHNGQEDHPGAAQGGCKAVARATVFFPEVRRTFPIVLHTQLPSYSPTLKLYFHL